MGLGIPPLKIKNLLESNPLKSIILVLRLAVFGGHRIGRLRSCVAVRGSSRQLCKGN